MFGQNICSSVLNQSDTSIPEEHMLDIVRRMTFVFHLSPFPTQCFVYSTHLSLYLYLYSLSLCTHSLTLSLSVCLSVSGCLTLPLSLFNSCAKMQNTSRQSSVRDSAVAGCFPLRSLPVTCSRHKELLSHE